ncbi:MAG: hypothetical protein IPL28_19540 [Chloroflexi bacterium]|nr:hypothetical protein [Chloroflexota bacterium]
MKVLALAFLILIGTMLVVIEGWNPRSGARDAPTPKNYAYGVLAAAFSSLVELINMSARHG